MDIGSKNEVPARLRSWSDLPTEILSTIADRLPLIELLCFRGTCKDFRSASAHASAKIESSRTPWVLFHKTGSSKCLFYNDHESKTYSRNIPDLEDAICLASYKGWLLLFREGSIFFFCPCSLAKIALPDFPHKQFNGHVAAFSDEPTSPNCIISVVNHPDDIAVDVHVISKGQKEWTHHHLPRGGLLSSTIVGATYDRHSRSFYYMDKGKTALTFSVKDKKWTPYKIVKSASKDIDPLPFIYEKHEFRDNIESQKHHLDLEEDEYFDVCGLTLESKTEYHHVMYLNEVVGESPAIKRMRRAVWVQPRFFEADPNQQW